MKHFLLFFCLAAFSCAPAYHARGTPVSFRYSDIAGKRIGFAKPIVISSEIFYENRFTNQSYHSIDRNRTQEAFLRDFRQSVSEAKLGWKSLDSATDSLLQARFAYHPSRIDSLPAAVREQCRAAGIDALVLVYGMKLYHFQSVGLRREKTGSVNSYGTVINKKIEYACSIIDISDNKALFYLPIRKDENGQNLNILGNSVNELLRALLQR
jgi:hypothetical protein